MSRPVLLDPAAAAVYARVKPATLRVWRHRYELTSYPGGGYALHELAAVLERREAA